MKFIQEADSIIDMAGKEFANMLLGNTRKRKISVQPNIFQFKEPKNKIKIREMTAEEKNQ